MPCDLSTTALTTTPNQLWTLPSRPTPTVDMCPPPGAFRVTNVSEVIQAVLSAIGCGPANDTTAPALSPCTVSINLVEIQVYDNAFRTVVFTHGSRFPDFRPATPVTTDTLALAMGIWWAGNGLPTALAPRLGSAAPDNRAWVWIKALDVALSGTSVASLWSRPAAWTLLQSTDHLGIACTGSASVPGPLPDAFFQTAAIASGLRNLTVSGCQIGGSLPDAWALAAGSPVPTSGYMHRWPMVIQLPGNRLTGDLTTAWWTFLNCTLSRLDVSNNEMSITMSGYTLNMLTASSAGVCGPLDARGRSVADAASSVQPYAGPGLTGTCGERRLFYTGVKWRSQATGRVAFVNVGFRASRDCPALDLTCAARAAATGHSTRLLPLLDISGNSYTLPTNISTKASFTAPVCPRSGPVLLIDPRQNGLDAMQPLKLLGPLLGAMGGLVGVAMCLGLWRRVQQDSKGDGNGRSSRNSGSLRKNAAPASPSGSPMPPGAEDVQHQADVAAAEADSSILGRIVTDETAMAVSKRFERWSERWPARVELWANALTAAVWFASSIVIITDMSLDQRWLACQAAGTHGGPALCSAATLWVVVTAFILPGFALGATSVAMWGWRHRHGAWWYSHPGYTTLMTPRTMFTWLLVGMVGLGLGGALAGLTGVLGFWAISAALWRTHKKHAAETFSMHMANRQVRYEHASQVHDSTCITCLHYRCMHTHTCINPSCSHACKCCANQWSSAFARISLGSLCVRCAHARAGGSYAQPVQSRLRHLRRAYSLPSTQQAQQQQQRSRAGWAVHRSARATQQWAAGRAGRGGSRV